MFHFEDEDEEIIEPSNDDAPIEDEEDEDEGIYEQED